MISKNTEDRTVELLQAGSPAGLLRQSENLDQETRQILEKLVILEEDLEHMEEIFPPTPEFSLPMKTAPKGQRQMPRDAWFLLPLAALLLLSLLFINRPVDTDGTDGLRGEPGAEGVSGDLPTAASSGNLARVELLLQQGAMVDQVNAQGRSALMLAAQENDVRVLELLIQFGAGLNQVDKQGRTALMIAASEGHPESTRFLLEQGADANQMDNDGATAADLAQENDYREVVSILESY